MDRTAKKQVIQDYYAARARDYDRQKSRTWKSSLGFRNEVSCELYLALRSLRNKIVLEIGVGTGRNALPLLEKAGFRLVGLDLSREMLDVLMAKSPHNKNLDLLVGDSENCPLMSQAFDGLLCMSTLHYFEKQDWIIQQFSDLLKEKGILVYGDLTLNERDSRRFFDELEKTISKAHTTYHKPSEMKKKLQIRGFEVSTVKTFAYKKSYGSLIEDKGRYFGVNAAVLNRFLARCNSKEKRLYSLTSYDMTLFYTVMTAYKRKALS